MRSFFARSWRRVRRAAMQRPPGRKLRLESLENRSLLAFNVLAEYATGLNPQDVDLALIDAGSQFDMVVAHGGAATVGVQLGNADGAFDDPQNATTGSNPRSVAAGDFTGDNIADLVTANAAGVNLLVGKGDGAFQPPVSISLPGQFPLGYDGSDPLPQSSLSLAAGDLDADGKLDLVVGTDTYFTQKSCYYGYYGYYYCNYFPNYDGYVNVLLGNGVGGFGAAQTEHLGAWRFPNAVEVGDINDDPHADVITANGNDLSVLLGDESGAVGAPSHSGSGFGLRSISLGDVDGDGKTDTLMSGGSGLIVQKGDGLGGFTALPSVSAGIPVNSAVLGDVNDDGKLDLVAVGSLNEFHCTSYGYYGCYDWYYTSTRQAAVLVGNGLGGFSLPLISPLGSEFGSGYLIDVAVEDLTGDGLPELATIDSSAGKSIVAANDGDWDPPPTIAISDAVAVAEGNSGTVNAVFTVTVVGDHDGLSVDYFTANDSAVADADYTTTLGTLTFDAGVSTKEISVPVKGDTLDEYDEQFLVRLTNAVGGQITDSQAAGVIQDDDAPPLVTIDNVSKNEGKRGVTSFSFTVRLSAPSGKSISVDYATANGTATLSNSDYIAASGTLSFTPGDTSEPITVQVRGDRKREANETFFVNLTAAVDGTISDNQGLGTIVNDDGGKGKLRLVSVGDASVVEGKSGVTTLVFTVGLSEPSDESVWVAYETANRTAKVSNKDYKAAQGRLHFAAGETAKTISVTIRGDSRQEADEYFYLKLFDADGGGIARGKARGVILDDDRR